MIIDATDSVLGRLASFAAKNALLGEKVEIINCEKAVISGNRADTIAKYKQKWGRTTIRRGPYIHRMPDRFVRRIVRGMLPYKQEKGDKAFTRVMCYIGTPKAFEGKQAEVVKTAHLSERQPRNTITVADVCKELGANI